MDITHGRIGRTGTSPVARETKDQGGLVTDAKPTHLNLVSDEVAYCGQLHTSPGTAMRTTKTNALTVP